VRVRHQPVGQGAAVFSFAFRPDGALWVPDVYQGAVVVVAP
jgi:streptogramin lyase